MLRELPSFKKLPSWPHMATSSYHLISLFSSTAEVFWVISALCLQSSCSILSWTHFIRGFTSIDSIRTVLLKVTNDLHVAKSSDYFLVLSIRDLSTELMPPPWNAFFFWLLGHLFIFSSHWAILHSLLLVPSHLPSLKKLMFLSN